MSRNTFSECVQKIWLVFAIRKAIVHEARSGDAYKCEEESDDGEEKTVEMLEAKYAHLKGLRSDEESPDL